MIYCSRTHESWFKDLNFFGAKWKWWKMMYTVSRLQSFLLGPYFRCCYSRFSCITIRQMRNSPRPSMSQSRWPALHNSFIKNASQHWALLSHIPNLNTLWLAASLIPMSHCGIYKGKYFRIPIRLSKQNLWQSMEIAR